jgi:multidrug efflux pump subunit AcrB
MPLVASRVVSMTFIPLLGGYLLRPRHELDRGAVYGFAARHGALGI